MRPLSEILAKAVYRIPEIKVPPWQYKPEGPYHVAVTPSTYQRGLELDEAFAVFVRFGLPTEDVSNATIVDFYGAVVIGYNHGPDGSTKWYGCEAGFDLYRDHPLTHPLEYELAVAHASNQI